MSATDKPQYDDGLVIQYLLGAMPEAEAVRLDELSIADDEFATRLVSVENDLVDAYVRGQLAGADLERFRSHYLLSPVRREKVRFAEALASTADRAPAPSAVPEPGRWWEWLRPAWQFAAAACLLLLAGGYLFYQNGQLRSQIGQAQQDRDTLQAREQQLQQQIEAQRSAAAAPQESRPPAPARTSLNAVALVLLPQTRGIEPPATIALAPDADSVNLQLQLEDDDFRAYRVRLKEPATNRILWQSDPLKSLARGTTKSVPVSLPAAALTPRTYSLELSGIPARGAAVSLSGYALRVVR
jgi:outer membrane murein-binding lipoprotein Lpp